MGDQPMTKEEFDGANTALSAAITALTAHVAALTT
ncbi:hypothetical protein A2U01_0074011 [Trifolium medium]|uniref:Uncharacterized protein n=1 Tax=Trifolium medium TaxID=97028 RepID=A0A392SXI1_9FABA|nr:hypothetical protein [Trifolium medium]